MKEGFDKPETFRCLLNVLKKLHCNEPDAFDRERAAAVLQQLTEEWGCDEEYAIMAVAQIAQSDVDARLRYMVEQAMDSLRLPNKEKYIKDWGNLSKGQKAGVVDAVIDLLTMMGKEGSK